MGSFFYLNSQWNEVLNLENVDRHPQDFKQSIIWLVLFYTYFKLVLQYLQPCY